MGIEGYEDTLPIAFIKNGDIEDSTLKEIFVWDYFSINPYRDIDYIFNYDWWLYISTWLGFSPERVDSKKFETMPQVIEMPCYPDYGSIKIIDETVVVKLADEKG